MRLPIAILVTLAAVPAAAQDMKPYSSFKDCETCPEMVLIAPGEFMMGATDKDARITYAEYNVPSERPRHKVSFAYAFAIGKYEVTVGELAQYAAETGVKPGGKCGIRAADFGPQQGKYVGTLHPDNSNDDHGPNFVIISDGAFDQPGLEVTDRHPATCISREEAKAYLKWLSAKTGRSYRLATEAEWEYATRAGTDTPYFWGDSASKACAHANFADKVSFYQARVMAPCAESIKPLWAAPAGSYEPNAWGLHDTAGNVQEMLEDCWHENYKGAPADGSPWMDASCDYYIARGGDYELPFSAMRSAERLFYGSETEPHDRYNVLGFRAAVSMSDGAWDKK